MGPYLCLSKDQLNNILLRNSEQIDIFMFIVLIGTYMLKRLIITFIQQIE